MEQLIGYVFEVEKNSFYMLFPREKDTTLQMHFKKKKLSLQQKELLKLGLIVKLDFETKKLFFKTLIEGEWI